MLLATDEPLRRPGRLHRRRTPGRRCSTAISASRPGTALVGFGLPAVVNGATHATDAVAAQGPARPHDGLRRRRRPAGLARERPHRHRPRQPHAEGRRLSLSRRRPSSPVRSTLDAEGDPDAQFVFEIASALTTASASSVVLLNGAYPVQRLLAGRQLGHARHHDGVPGQPDGALEHLAQQRRHGDRPAARPQRRGQPDQQRHRRQPLQHRIGIDAHGGSGSGSGTGTGTGTAKALLAAQANQASNPKRTTTRNGTTSFERTPHATCTSGFRATVHGKLIKRVVFTLDGKRISNLVQAPLQRVRAGHARRASRERAGDVQGRHQGEDAALGYKACADAVLSPTTGPSAFTG